MKAIPPSGVVPLRSVFSITRASLLVLKKLLSYLNKAPSVVGTPLVVVSLLKKIVDTDGVLVLPPDVNEFQDDPSYPSKSVPDHLIVQVFVDEVVPSFIAPLTSNFSAGELVPIPTFPAPVKKECAVLSKCIRSLLEASNIPR